MTERKADVDNSDRRMQTLRTCAIVTSLAACAFGWISLLTFDSPDWPNPAVWPHPNPIHNSCGRAGSWLAYHAFYCLGDGLYPFAFVLTLRGLVLLARRQISDKILRLVGLCMLVTATATTSAMMHPDPTSGLAEGRGGILGAGMAVLLRENVSSLGATLSLVAGFSLGLLLVADDVIFRIPSFVISLRRLGLRETLAGGSPAPSRFTSPPKVMGAGNTAATTAAAATAVDEEDTGDEIPATAAERPEEQETLEESDAEADETDDSDDAPDADAADAGPLPERELIIRMLGKDRVEGKSPKSSWPTELGDYVLPPLSLLRDPDGRYNSAQEGVVRDQAAILERTLAEFRIEVRVVEIDTGPVVTMFELELSAGTKVSQINSLANDIARALKAPAVRVVAPLPGKNTIGIEVPNVDKERVRLKELIMLSGVKPTKMALPIFVGKNASGDPLITDLAAMPHLLIAGTTGSGKSVAINALVMSVLMTQRPDHVKLILIDPKMVELNAFKEIPHLMCPIVTDMQRAEMILEWATTKMDERYELLAEASVKDISGFNRLGKEAVYERFQPSTEEEKLKIPTHLPYIVIIIDELADLMMTSGKEVEHHLSRLAQKSRAVGVHIVIATQRPQANVVTGLVKSNLPCRMAFRVASRMDSRIVLDQNGAEVLMGQGDMLFLPPGSSKLIRAQGTFIEDDELRSVLKDLSEKAKPEFHHELQRLRPEGDDGGGERDPLFDKAVDIIVQTRRGSVSLLQRRLEVGYSRASRLIDQMAAAGIVGEYKGSQAREVLITDKEWEQIRKRRDHDMDDGHYQADLDAEDDEVYGTADAEDEHASRLN